MKKGEEIHPFFVLNQSKKVFIGNGKHMKPLFEIQDTDNKVTKNYFDLNTITIPN